MYKKKIYVDKTDSKFFLDKKIEYFYDWCCKNKIKYSINDIKSLVEKMSVWYELRYPNIYFGDESFDDVMFENYSLNSVQRKWCDFYNYNKFFYSLSDLEKEILTQRGYPDIVYFDDQHSKHFHLSEAGFISCEETFNFKALDGSRVCCGKQFVNKHISFAVEYMKPIAMDIDFNQVEKIIDRVEFEKSIYEGVLNTVLYRIIERGGKIYGPRRGLLFAKEFGRNIDTVVKYGDPTLIKEYLDNNGDLDLCCYVDYFSGSFVTDKAKNIVIFADDYEKPKIKVFSK